MHDCLKQGIHRRIAAGWILAVVLALASGCAKQPSSLSGPSPNEMSPAQQRKVVVARVNGADVTLYALNNMTNRMLSINEKSSVKETPEETRKKALDQLIFRELAYQEAMREGLKVEDQRVDREMSRFIASVGHEEGYNDYLEKQQTTPVEVRAEVERALLLQMIAVREVAEKAGTATDEEVLKEYELHQSAFLSPETVLVSDIALAGGPDEEKSTRKAEELLGRIQSEKDKGFGALVSDGTFTVRNRQLTKDGDPELYEAARRLKEGEVSGVVKTADGVHILHLDRYEPGKQLSFDEVKGPLKQQLDAKKQLQRFQEWEVELKKDAKIEILDDPDAKK